MNKNTRENMEQMCIYVKNTKIHFFKCVFVYKNINELELMEKIREIGAFPMDYETDYINQVFVELKNGKRKTISTEGENLKINPGDTILVESRKKEDY